MHRIAGAIVLFLLTIVLVISGFTINTKTSASVNQKIASAAEACRQEQLGQAQKQAASALKEWNDNKETMLLFVSHGRLDQIEESLNIACSCIDAGDTDLFMAECTRIEVYLKHFNDLEYPTINNIF